MTTWPIKKLGEAIKKSKFKMQKSKLKLPEPYSWMINDLENSIKLAKANYLVALGLFCYSEIIGRHILKHLNVQEKDISDNVKCFNKFVSDYMGYKKIVKKYKGRIYGWFRDGLCHEYYIKGQQTSVFVIFEKKTSRQGIVISKDEKKRYLVVKPYLRDFKKGIKKFLKEKCKTGQQKN